MAVGLVGEWVVWRLREVLDEIDSKLDASSYRLPELMSRLRAARVISESARRPIPRGGACEKWRGKPREG